jgi:hypothetical protein
MTRNTNSKSIAIKASGSTTKRRRPLTSIVATSTDEGNVRASQAKVKQVKKDLRDKVCVPANGYAGKVEDYTFVPGFCVNKNNRGKPKTTKVNKNGTISVDATRKEIKILEEELAKFPPGASDGNVTSEKLPALIAIFTLMLSVKHRRNTPNPVERYAYLTQDKSVPLPTFTILSLVCEALKDKIGFTGTRTYKHTRQGSKLSRP